MLLLLVWPVVVFVVVVVLQFRNRSAWWASIRERSICWCARHTIARNTIVRTSAERAYVLFFLLVPPPHTSQSNSVAHFTAHNRFCCLWHFHIITHKHTHSPTLYETAHTHAHPTQHYPVVCVVRDHCVCFVLYCGVPCRAALHVDKRHWTRNECSAREHSLCAANRLTFYWYIAKAPASQ